MSLREKTHFWRALGAFLNTGLGAWGSRATRSAVNRLGAAFYAPRFGGAIPFVKPGKPLRESTIAIVTTSGVHLASDEPFDVDATQGDPTYRIVPTEARAADLRVSHAHYSHRYVDEDLNVVFPLDSLRELAAEGAFRLAPRHFAWGFLGTTTRALVDPRIGKAHEVARLLREDGVDLVVLVPA